MIEFVLGDYAIARLYENEDYTKCSKVKITKDEKGKFFGEMLLGYSKTSSGYLEVTKICYYVEVCQNKKKLWVPWEHLQLCERPRPFYGRDVKKSSPQKINTPKRKRKIYEDYILPMTMKVHSATKPDFNATYDQLHVPKECMTNGNAFQDFVRRGKEMVFDDLLNDKCCEENKEKYWKFLVDSEMSTEDKFEMLIDNVLTIKEIENYLYQCWRYNVIIAEGSSSNGGKVTGAGVKENGSQINVHTNWCSVCGKRDDLNQCPNCPACFHAHCKNNWAVYMSHRKIPPKSQDIVIKNKKLSSTRTIKTYQKETFTSDLCPSCLSGPAMGYGDVVWHKLGSCPWWPAKVLPPGSLPSCLISRKHSVHQWPVRYYGTLNHSWCDASRMCLFLPTHTAVLDEDKPVDLKNAVMEACDDYIIVYLT